MRIKNEQGVIIQEHNPTNKEDLLYKLVEAMEDFDERLDELEARLDQWITEESVEERAFKKMLFKVVAEVSGISKNKHALVAFAEVMERYSDKDIEEYAELIKKVYPEIQQDIEEGVYNG